jgi:hypothetical protein
MADKKTKRQISFEEVRQDYTDRDIQMETLYTNWLIKNTTEQVRSDTSKIVWIIVISTVLTILGTLIGLNR